MVPHRRILCALALVGLSRADGDAAVTTLADELQVAFPCPREDFTQQVVLPLLPPAMEAALLTTDFAATGDYRMAMAAAVALGVATVIAIDHDGLTVALSPVLAQIRAHGTMRVFVETCLLAKISPEQIADDLRRIYGMTVTPDDISAFTALFVDPYYVHGAGWREYETCIGPAEALFKRQLMGQPADFVRWKLGLPVTLASSTVVDRMISDAYYTERLIKSQSGTGGLSLGKDELARVKMERDTIFKGLNARNKLIEIERNSGAGTNETKDAAAALSRIVLEYTNHSFKPADTAKAESVPSVADLEAENTAT